MKRYHVPSLLLGFGLGLLITALTGVVFFSIAPANLSDEEIMERAAALGMQHPGQAEWPMAADGMKTLELSGTEGVSALAQRLSASGVLDAPLAFEILARQETLPDPLPQGVYLLPVPCDAQALVETLKAGPQADVQDSP
jgi:cell division protein YceG involved in septum cleavage